MIYLNRIKENTTMEDYVKDLDKVFTSPLLYNLLGTILYIVHCVQCTVYIACSI